MTSSKQAAPQATELTPSKVPAKAWGVTFAGMAINLCLGILYAWSIWKKALSADAKHAAGTLMHGLNEGWVYLNDAQATWAYATCGFVFALSMIPGGKLQDKLGPRIGVTLGGLFLATGCIVAGLMRSFPGLVLGFGLLGGIGMGLGYASATPAAVRWFGPHKRGLIVGIVVGGYGGAAIYISPLATTLIKTYGISGSFIALGILFAIVVIIAGRLLSMPPEGYVAPGPPVSSTAKVTQATASWTAAQMVKTWQFYALVFIFFGSAQSGLLVIGNAVKVLNDTAKGVPFLVAAGWILSSFGGIVNASGRICTGIYSDKLGRKLAFAINGLVSVLCLALTPYVMKSGNVALLFLVVGVAFWQYGGGLALLPALTADYFGPKHLGYNYGLVFLGWGLAFFVPQLAGYMKVAIHTMDPVFYLAAGIQFIAILVSQKLTRPQMAA